MTSEDPHKKHLADVSAHDLSYSRKSYSDIRETQLRGNTHIPSVSLLSPNLQVVFNADWELCSSKVSPEKVSDLWCRIGLLYNVRQIIHPYLSA